jgi:pimeloyl-ACP methyl ester carboxylesterase
MTSSSFPRPDGSPRFLRGLLLALLQTLLLASCLSTRDWPETARTADGAALRYLVDGEGEPTLVFVHDWACHRQYWTQETRRFALVRRVVALDLMGHGESDAQRSAWTIPAFGEDVVRVCDALQLERVVLIGHGIGAGVALEAARRLGPRCRAVVAIDALHDVSKRATPEEVEAAVAALRSDFPKAVDLFARANLFSAQADERLVDHVAERMSAQPPEVALAVFAAALSHDAGAALAAVDVPVHCINTSRATNVEAGRARNARFTAVDWLGNGHFPMLENPEGLARRIADFVRPLGDG